MPRVSIDPKNSKFRQLKILINGAATADEKSPETLGLVIGVGRCTAYKYLRSPEKLSLENLLKIGRNLGIPIEELRECMRY